MIGCPTPKLLVLLLALLPVGAGILLSSCSRGKTDSGSDSSTSSTQAAAVPTPKTGFEADLDYVRKGQYTYIWVFARKDSKPLDKNDAAYLRTNAPQVVDWVTSDEGRKVIAGTNFDLAKGNLELLKKRFNVEDYTGK